MNLIDTSFWIGALLKEKLEDISPVYPLIAEFGAPDTFITYRRTGYSSSNTKDISDSSETLAIEVRVVSPSYDLSLQKAQEVKNRLDKRRGRWREVMIDRINLVNAYEAFADNVYVQTLVFSVVIDE